MAKQKKRRLKKKYRVLRGIYAAVVAVAAVIVIGYGVYKVAVPAPEMKPAAANATQEEEVAPGMEQGSHTRREQTYTFLLACPDQVSGNADAIMLVTYDVPNQKIGMLSVPRDTLVDESSPKINSSLHGGIENLQDVVSDLVGYPIDFYITIDLDGFVELVDAVLLVEEVFSPPQPARPAASRAAAKRLAINFFILKTPSQVFSSPRPAPPCSCRKRLFFNWKLNQIINLRLRPVNRKYV